MTADPRYGRVDGTTWPIPGDTEWHLRYGPHPNMHAASIAAAYAFLVDPSRSQKDAIESLKRARKAVGDDR
mgnify:CR=1 FL=1